MVLIVFGQQTVSNKQLQVGENREGEKWSGCSLKSLSAPGTAFAAPLSFVVGVLSILSSTRSPLNDRTRNFLKFVPYNSRPQQPFCTRDWFHGRQFCGWGRGKGDSLGMIQEHYIYCALYFYYCYIVIYNEIIIQLTIIQNQWEPGTCFPELRW